MTTKILFIGEAWGREEAEAQQPFIGASGGLLRGFLRDLGFLGQWIDHPVRQGKRLFVPDNVAFTNVLNLQPKPTNDISNCCGPRADGIPGLGSVAPGKYILREYLPEIERLLEEIQTLNPNLIVTLGNTPLAVLTHNPGKITKNRGTITLSEHCRRPDGSYFKILPTFHPAAVLRDMQQRPVVLRDLMKAKRHMRGPEFHPPRRIAWLAPDLSDLNKFYDQHLRDRAHEPWGVDIETTAGTITEIGFARPDIGIVIPFFSRETPDKNYWPDLNSELSAWGWVRSYLNTLCNPVFQNGLYDLNYLFRLRLNVPRADDDTMLLHHAMQPEMKKGLGFLASIYSDAPAWKFMRKDSGTLKKEDD